MRKRVNAAVSGVSLVVVLLSYLMCVTVAISVLSIATTGGRAW